jgi:hypothetical protein
MSATSACGASGVAGAFPKGQANQFMRPLLDSKAQQFVRKFRTRRHLTALYARTRIQHGATLE